jgi:hypothetical protein
MKSEMRVFIKDYRGRENLTISFIQLQGNQDFGAAAPLGCTIMLISTCDTTALNEHHEAQQ